MHLRRRRLLIVSHAVVRRSGDTWFTFNRAGEVAARLDALGWKVTLVAREASSELATYPLRRSIDVCGLRAPWSRGTRLGPWLMAAAELVRAPRAVVSMPSLFAALTTFPLGRRAVMYAGGSWGLRADFPAWRGRLEVLAARRVSHVVVAGEALGERFAPYACSLELCVPHVHAEVAARLQDPSATDGAAGGPPRVLFVGGINPLKGIRELLYAARALPDVAFRLVGQTEDDQLAEEVRSASEALPNLSFGRYREWEQLREEYEWANILALPSYTEGFPRILYEGAAFGLALVTTPVGGIPARLRDGCDSLFVGVGSGDSLVQALRRLAKSPTLRLELARGARATLSTSFQEGDAAEQLDRALRRSVPRRRRSVHIGSRGERTNIAPAGSRVPRWP
jgi:glycosyltransferase involved in cell wall biosynthesis